MAARTATPLLTTTLAIAAAAAAILVGCTRHPVSEAPPASFGTGVAYDPSTGGATDAHATFNAGDPGGVTDKNGPPASGSTPG